MPKAKKNPDKKLEKKLEKKPTIKIKAPIKKTETKKTAVKKLIPSKKIRPVVVDIIEDDEEEKDEVFFPELPKGGIRSVEASANGPLVTDVEEDDEEEVTEAESKKPLTREAILELDQQKKFYSKLVTEIKEKKPKEPTVHKSVNLYRRLVWRFVALTAILLIAVFYFSFSKLTITIAPKGETISDSLALNIQPVTATTTTATTTTISDDSQTDFREQIPGTIIEEPVSETKTYAATGEEYTGEEVSGQVNIINNSPKAQALVATTRILSPDNKLFRIKNAVNVPAGGEVAVDIYTDKPSEDMAIAASTFTIPGLWLGLQDKIYAKSTADFVYQQKVKKYIKASDIQQAEKEMSDMLISKVKQNQSATGEAGSEASNTETLYETLDETSFTTSAKAGDSVDNFTVTASGKLLVIRFSKDQVSKLASSKLTLLVPDDKELVNYDPSSIAYTFDNYDTKTGSATVKASFGGTMVLKNNTDIIDKKQLVNLNRQQLANYLKTFPEIKSYELSFFPGFITRAPRLPERIHIEIKGLEN